MKHIKIIIVCIIVLFIVFFPFQKADKINLAGDWNANKIVINGQQVYPSEIGRYNKFPRQIKIDNWTDSIYIPNHQDGYRAHFTIRKDADRKPYMVLSSAEKSLNGNFQMKIDTSHVSSTGYTVEVELQSNTALLYLERRIQYKQWDPGPLHRGQLK